MTPETKARQQIDKKLVTTARWERASTIMVLRSLKIFR